MRQIKFRAYGVFTPFFDDKRKKYEMIHDPIIKDGKCYTYETPFGDCYGSSRMELKKCSAILMQYTGRKDKTGKEIYDGDLMHNGDPDYGVGVISFSSDHNGWILDDGCLVLGSDDLTDAMKDYWVIGDIHTTPELLEDNQ